MEQGKGLISGRRVRWMDAAELSGCSSMNFHLFTAWGSFFKGYRYGELSLWVTALFHSLKSPIEQIDEQSFPFFSLFQSFSFLTRH